MIAANIALPISIGINTNIVLKAAKKLILLKIAIVATPAIYVNKIPNNKLTINNLIVDLPFVRLIRYVASGKDNKNPPVGDSKASNPLLYPLKTGIPITPITRYKKTLKKASNGFRMAPITIIIKSCKVTGIPPIYIGGTTTVNTQIKAVNIATLVKLFIFIFRLRRQDHIRMLFHH